MSSRFGLAESPSGVGIVAPNTYILVSNGDGTWSPAAQGGGGGAVSSVFGRAGAVVAVVGDYNSDQVSNNSGVDGSTVSDALDFVFASIPAVPVASVFGRVGAVVAVANDYAASEVENDSSVSGDSVKDALNVLLAAIPSASISPLEVQESGSTGDWQGDGSADWIKEVDGGAFIECSFATWNANDILSVTWWGNFKPTGTPGAAIALFQVQVSLDAGATWRNLAPAFSTAQFDNTVFESFFGVGGSSSVALATTPIVRVAYQSDRIQVDYGSLATGVFLRCNRFAAGSYTPRGTLLP